MNNTQSPSSVDLLRRLLVRLNLVDESRLTSEEEVVKAAQAALSQPEGRMLLVVSGGVMHEVVDGMRLARIWVVDCDNGQAGDRYVLPSYMRDLCERYWETIPDFVSFEDEEEKVQEAPRG
jgi:hypothetical protein